MKANTKYCYPNIEAERARLGMSQKDVVSKLGCCRKSYYSWVIKGNIPASALIKLSDIFNCSTDYLLGKTCNPARL